MELEVSGRELERPKQAFCLCRTQGGVQGLQPGHHQHHIHHHHHLHYHCILIYVNLPVIKTMQFQIVQKINLLQCHVFAELDLDQPARAIVNFVNKLMMSTSNGSAGRPADMV